VLTLQQRRVKTLQVLPDYAKRKALKHFARCIEIATRCSRAAVYFYLKMCCHVKNLPTGIVNLKLTGDYANREEVDSVLNNLAQEVEIAIVKMEKRILSKFRT